MQDTCCQCHPYMNSAGLHADPEKIIREGGYWGNTLVGETEEQPGEKSRTVILEMKVLLGCPSHVMSEHLWQSLLM